MNLVPQFGFLELILIAIVALVVVGPKDLPRLMRQAGRMVGKARAMASEFTSAFDQMARETEMEELRKEIDSLKNDNAISKAKRELDEAVKPINDEVREATKITTSTGAESKPAAPGSDDASTEKADAPQ